MTRSFESDALMAQDVATGEKEDPHQPPEVWVQPLEDVDKLKLSRFRIPAPC